MPYLDTAIRLCCLALIATSLHAGWQWTLPRWLTFPAEQAALSGHCQAVEGCLGSRVSLRFDNARQSFQPVLHIWVKKEGARPGKGNASSRAIAAAVLDRYDEAHRGHWSLLSANRELATTAIHYE